MILLACSKRSEIIAAPEPSVTPCTHMCRGVCTVGACPAYELAHLAGEPRAIAVNTTKVVVATDGGLEVVDKKTHTVRKLHPSCVGDRGLAASEREVFYVHCGSEIEGIDLGSAAARVLTVLKTAVVPERVVASGDRVAWLGGGRLEIVTTSGDPMGGTPRDVADVQLVGDRIYWSMTDQSVWTLLESGAPSRVVRGYDARGPFAANQAGIFWPNRHDRTLVRFTGRDKWPQWLGYDPLSADSTQAVADGEWLYYRHAKGISRIGHAHWSEPTLVADSAIDMATDGTTFFYLVKRDGTSLMALEP